MADQTVPVMYPNTSATTEGAIPADRQPPISQGTNPTTGPNDPVREVPHADDHDSGSAGRTQEER